jgi:coenzyme F420-reducing hydrogenase delta subunit
LGRFQIAIGLSFTHIPTSGYQFLVDHFNAIVYENLMWQYHPRSEISAIQKIVYFPTIWAFLQRCPNCVTFSYATSKLNRGVERLFLRGHTDDESQNVCMWMEQNLTGKCRIKTSNHHILRVGGIYEEPRHMEEVWEAKFWFAKSSDAVKFRLMFSE